MIKLYGNQESVLSVNFDDIVNQIPDIEIYKWKLVWIEGVNFKIEELFLSGGFKDMEEFSEAVENSPNGYLIKANKLIKLSKSFFQAYDLLLIGDKQEDSLDIPLNSQGNIEEKELKNKVEFYIELVDTSYWEITSTNEIFNQRMKENLDGIEVDE
ncbi:MAG: hypothetical protein LUH15_07665 [Tannerellaceae bacterium]|nr:hypothetical protein [Tannerellaceae bacterium]